MELDFDKEIDALLRKAQRDAPVLVGDFASQRHLDADEISAFAENAMPEKSRALYTAHMADCDRCRKILSNLLVMNAEAMPATASPASAITIAERSLPWYKRLFLFPNLAYVMGSLVLIFAGFLGYTVIRNTGAGESAMVSQAGEPDAQSGPNFQSEPSAMENESAADMANTAANAAVTMPHSTSANANAMSADSLRADRGPGAGARSEENNFVLDGADTSAAPVAAAPPPALSSQPSAAPKEARDRDDAAKAKAEDKVVALQESAKNDAMLKQAPSAGQTIPSQSGPMRNNESQYNRQLENLDRRAAAKTRSAREEEKDSSGRRVVGGKTFERKQQVWYDTAYQGRPTINVRRGTDEFNRLDGGLRSIANSLGGTVVIVWGAKAYRIQ